MWATVESMSTLVPYLTFANGERSMAFLRDVLGFGVVSEQRDDAGRFQHVELRRGEALVMAGEGEPAPGSSPGIYLVVDDVDGTFAAAVAAGAIGIEPPTDTAWDSRRARFTDLDGHEWSLGTYRPGQGA